MPLPKTFCSIFLISLFRNVACNSYELRDTDEGCTLATPTLKSSDDGTYTMILPYNISNQIKYDEKVQVGYLKTFRVFQYLGCVDTYDLRNIIDTHDVKSGPGQCYSLCKSQYFAIHLGSCFCLKNKISATSNRCNLMCSYHRYTVCGGYWYRSAYASIYKYVSVPPDKRGIDDEKNCRVYITLTDTYEWASCDSKFSGACDSNETVTTKQSWKEYTAYCFTRGRNPASANLTNITNEPIVWIGHIKSWAVIKAIESDTEDRTLDYKGYLEISMNKTILNFQKEIKSTKYLCEKVSGQTSIDTTEATLPASENLSTSTTIIVQRQADQECRKHKHSLLAIYIVAPLFLIVSVVSVVLFIKLRQRNKEIREFKGHSKTGARNDTIIMQNFEEECNTETERGINLNNISEEQIANYNYIHATTANDVVEDQATPDREYDDTVSQAYTGLARRTDDKNMYMTLHEDEQNYMLCS